METRGSLTVARFLLLLFVGTILAGCADASQEYSFQLTQCEDPVWGEATDSQAISNHYGVEVKSVKIVTDNRIYAAVCGGPSYHHVVITIHGSADGLTGWVEGAP